MERKKLDERELRNEFMDIMITVLNGEIVPEEEVEKKKRLLREIADTYQAYSDEILVAASSTSDLLKLPERDDFERILKELRWLAVEIDKEDFAREALDCVRLKPEAKWCLIGNRIYFHPETGKAQAIRKVKTLHRPELYMSSLFSRKQEIGEKISGKTIVMLCSHGNYIFRAQPMVEEMSVLDVKELARDLSPNACALFLSYTIEESVLYEACPEGVFLLAYGPGIEEGEAEQFLIHYYFTAAPLVGLSGEVRDGKIKDYRVPGAPERGRVTLIGRKTGRYTIVTECWTAI